ncbi:MAG TPA: tetratricopeptide repeat protein [Polyangiaceae bacterium]|nr:tetratricopeptide repeat protein [Polyangiaceae bacterium]
MDVRCNRCATEYDFDDALISERGTTVKCTNCGYQFKVFPPEAQAGAPERWLVKTAAGAEVVFTSLRELQRGIADRRVGPNDLLSRGNQPARPLGSIAELEPFFNNSDAAAANAKPVRTLHGVAPVGRVSAAPAAEALSAAPPAEPRSATLPAPGSPPEAPSTQSVGASSAAFAPTVRAAQVEPGKAAVVPRRRPPEAAQPAAPTRNLTPAGPNPVPAPSPSGAAPVAAVITKADDAYPTPPGGTSLEEPRPTPQGGSPISVAAPVTPRANSLARTEAVVLTPSPARAALGSSPFSSRGGSSPELRSSPNSASMALRGSSPELRSSPNSSPFSTRGSSPELRSSPNSSPFGRRDLRSYDELSSDELPEVGRRARSRWIAAVVILGVTTLFAVTVGRRYLLETAGPAAQASATSSARVGELLREGTRLIEEGDLDGASEPLLRATALVERDRGVLAAIARLETLRADTTWLRLRLLDPQVTELVQATHRELGRRVGKARSATDAAFAVGPEDIVVLRARVDTLRLSGEADKAREWIKPIANTPSDPQNAYVLAALDLADANPSWSSIIDRLQVAVSGERVPGRAHAALVYALARGGRLAEAEAEVSKLDASPNAALLIDELKSFLKRYGKSSDGGASAAVAAVDPRKLGKLDTSPAEEPRPASEAQRAPSGEEARGGDFRKSLSDAADAMRKGDVSRAQDLYLKVLSDQPGNTEALAGLADVARRRNNPGEAARLYDRVLDNNPSYLPALMARADLQWESGNKKAAVALYKRVVDQAGTGTEYGQRAAARIAQDSEHAAQAPEPAAPSKSAAPAASTAPAAPAPAPAAPDGIDTTDLPGFK